ncbi:hypothetical protein BPJM79_20136 [Bacillus pumilus]
MFKKKHKPMETSPMVVLRMQIPPFFRYFHYMKVTTLLCFVTKI